MKDSHTTHPNKITTDGKRLQLLIRHPKLDPRLKQDIEQRLGRVILLQKMCMYGGAAIFCLHMLRNRMKIARTTPLFVIWPYIGQLGVKWGGYLWIDWKYKSDGTYQAYRIYE